MTREDFKDVFTFVQNLSRLVTILKNSSRPVETVKNCEDFNVQLELTGTQSRFFKTVLRIFEAVR